MKKVPSVVQLPGGVRLSAVPFRITERFEDGRPKTFEIQDKDAAKPDDDDCWLFADAVWIRKPKK